VRSPSNQQQRGSQDDSGHVQLTISLFLSSVARWASGFLSLGEKLTAVREVKYVYPLGECVYSVSLVGVPLIAVLPLWEAKDLYNPAPLPLRSVSETPFGHTLTLTHTYPYTATRPRLETLYRS
jgi:hypothetical protein